MFPRKQNGNRRSRCIYTSDVKEPFKRDRQTVNTHNFTYTPAKEIHPTWRCQRSKKEKEIKSPNQTFFFSQITEILKGLQGCVFYIKSRLPPWKIKTSFHLGTPIHLKIYRGSAKICRSFENLLAEC